MRISTQQAFQSGVTAMQRAQSELSHTQLQLATGRRILTPADDPAGATQAGQLNAAIRANEQYQRNADYAQPRLEQEEASIIAMENLLQRARELVLAGNNDTQNDQTRSYLASEIHQLRDDLIDIANTRDANDEYLFAGTRSFVQPFNKEADGSVGYVGAQGAGAVREVELSSTSTIAVGDSGDVLFMDLPERSGLVLEAQQPLGNTGSLVVEETQIRDREDFDATAGERFEIRFADNAGTMEYSVVDDLGNVVLDKSGTPIQGVAYNSGDAIEFAGRSVTLTGAPADGDTVVSRPAEHRDIFATLDAIATALETPVSDPEVRARLSESVEIALGNIDSGLDRLSDVRSTVGSRLQTLETQTELNAERELNLESTLSDIQDVDYAEAISRFKLQEIVLQAAQQTYVQVNRLSLFDFL
ncbi:flagellar hook protein [Marichromatium purpuratum 984]|uniref:Flagellar hook protein n=1 Tax=Marichromatium purpuratum 984 TaxID=765910 RepID=W0E2F1_MARPU|nr:flagellar hook-associated protein FlgL [Marichromatium purpuratum]AHF03668.1 flagellar hook protein [Marichromatium purpuratum 984]